MSNTAVDNPEMQDAINWLQEKRISFRRPDQWTLKIGPFSYWPHTQRLFRDGDEGKARQSVGLTALASVLGFPAGSRKT